MNMNWARNRSAKYIFKGEKIMGDNKSQELQMDNTNIQGEANNETYTNHVAEERTKKKFTFKKAIKYIVIFVVILIVYNVFFSGDKRAIRTVKSASYYNNYGDATTPTMGDYFENDNVGDSEYAEPITSVDWSAELNDTGTNYIVTLTYEIPSNGVDPEEDNSSYVQANNITTIKWYVDGNNINCIYYAKSFFDGSSFDLSGDDAEDRLLDKINNNNF